MTTEDAKDSLDEALLDAKNMDGPAVKWAPNDVFRSSPRAFLSYHVASSGFQYLNIVGVTLGGVVGMIPPLKNKIVPRMTALQAAGTFGIGTGICGMALGLGLMYKMSKAKDPKIPFTDEGIQMRVDGLSHNFQVRVMDLSVAGGLCTAGGLIAVLGPASFGLSIGSLGVLQGLSLGSAAGGLAAIGCVAVNKDKLPGSENSIQ